ncbi:hypothetical protein T439DRAFT_358507 [Meredithblackwellia eburnea MCA 4105]
MFSKLSVFSALAIILSASSASAGNAGKSTSGSWGWSGPVPTSVQLCEYFSFSANGPANVSTSFGLFKDKEAEHELVHLLDYHTPFIAVGGLGGNATEAKALAPYVGQTIYLHFGPTDKSKSGGITQPLTVKGLDTYTHKDMCTLTGKVHVDEHSSFSKPAAPTK